MDIVISDLDGTLLDHETYSFESARPGMALLKRRSIPLIFCTSKTRSEVEYWRTRMGNEDPFIVENGGAAFVPNGYFDFPVPDARRIGKYLMFQLGSEYRELVAVLEAASARTGCRLRSFHEMTVSEVSASCNLSPEIATFAKDREFDEPFVILDAGKERDLMAAIEAAGKHCTRGGRFCHIAGNSDKAKAVQLLVEMYRRHDPLVRSIGLGDGLNDAPFLRSVDVPVLIHTPWLEQLQAAVPKGVPTASPGPLGWNEAITAIFR